MDAPRYFVLLIVLHIFLTPNYHWQILLPDNQMFTLSYYQGHLVH